MKAYKFRSCEKYEFILDILNNQRLYCADPRNLNDPLEGYYWQERIPFLAEQQRKNESQIARINTDLIRSQLRICSLTKDYKNHCLWAYYAGNFTGVAIEFELPDPDSEIYHVRYGPHPDVGDGIGQDMRQRACQQLSSKPDDWKHEKEVRIITSSEYYKAPVTGLILGLKVPNQIQKDLITLCNNKNISVSKIEFDFDFSIK